MHKIHAMRTARNRRLDSATNNVNYINMSKNISCLLTIFGIVTCKSLNSRAMFTLPGSSGNVITFWESCVHCISEGVWFVESVVCTVHETAAGPSSVLGLLVGL